MCTICAHTHTNRISFRNLNSFSFIRTRNRNATQSTQCRRRQIVDRSTCEIRFKTTMIHLQQEKKHRKCAQNVNEKVVIFMTFLFGLLYRLSFIHSFSLCFLLVWLGLASKQEFSCCHFCLTVSILIFTFYVYVFAFCVCARERARVCLSEFVLKP